MEVRGRQRGSARWTIRYRDWKSRVCWSCYWGRQMVSDSCLYDCCSPRQSDSFLRAAASCPVFPRLTNRTAGQLSPFLPPRYTAAPDASPSCLCLIFLFNIHIVMIVECAVRLLSSIAWRAGGLRGMTVLSDPCKESASQQQSQPHATTDHRTALPSHIQE